MNNTNLADFNNSHYRPGGSIVKRFLWYFTNAAFLNSAFPINFIKIFVLRLYGAKIGSSVIIKPHVNIKYPWRLTIGNNVWIGECVWIDNLADVFISNDVCISQGAMLLCGNHDYKKSSFDLLTKNINLEQGVWIGAKSIVCPGVTCFSHAVLAVGSVASSDLNSFTIYQGNPAVKIRERIIV